MVQGDGGDHRDPPVGDVGRVPGTAHAHLEHDGERSRLREGLERHGGHHLEERQRAVAGLHLFQHRPEAGVHRGERVLVERDTIQDDAFPHGLQVGAGVAPHPQAGGPQQVVDRPRGGRLAVLPVTWMTGTACCGLPSASVTARMRSSDGSSRLSGHLRSRSPSTSWTGRVTAGPVIGAASPAPRPRRRRPAGSAPRPGPCRRPLRPGPPRRRCPVGWPPRPTGPSSRRRGRRRWPRRRR